MHAGVFAWVMRFGAGTLLPIMLAALVGAPSLHSAIHQDDPVKYVLAGESDSESVGQGDNDGDPSENGTIDCSIPDNADDTGCDTGDVSDGGSGPTQPRPAQSTPAQPTPALPAPAPASQPSGTPTPSLGGSDTDTGRVPRGGVSTGAGGTAGRRAAVPAGTAR